MALISCPECGQDVSSQAISCPHCGFPLALEEPPLTDPASENPSDLDPAQSLSMPQVSQQAVAWFWVGSSYLADRFWLALALPFVMGGLSLFLSSSGGALSGTAFLFALFSGLPLLMGCVGTAAKWGSSPGLFHVQGQGAAGKAIRAIPYLAAASCIAYSIMLFMAHAGLGLLALIILAIPGVSLARGHWLKEDPFFSGVLALRGEPVVGRDPISTFFADLQQKQPPIVSKIVAGLWVLLLTLSVSIGLQTIVALGCLAVGIAIALFILSLILSDRRPTTTVTISDQRQPQPRSKPDLELIALAAAARATSVHRPGMFEQPIVTRFGEHIQEGHGGPLATTLATVSGNQILEGLGGPLAKVLATLEDNSIKEGRGGFLAPTLATIQGDEVREGHGGPLSEWLFTLR